MPIYKSNGKKNGLQKYNVRINFTSKNGKAKQLTRTAYGYEAAKDLELKLSLELKTQGDPDKRMTVKQLVDEFVVVKQYEVREGTLKKSKQILRDYILPTFGKVRIDKITVDMLRDWKLLIEEAKIPTRNNGEKKLALLTKKHTYSDFRALLNYAVKMEYLQRNPITKIGNFKDTTSLEKEIEFYTSEEFIHFIGAAKKVAMEKQEKDNNLSEWDYYVFFNIAFYTGLRKGEIHALKWSDINKTHLSVKRSISQSLRGDDRETLPKNKSSIRTLQMPMPLVQILLEHKKRQMRFEDFSNDSRICGFRKCLRNTTIQNRNVLYATLSGQKNIRIHDFRHSHVSVLANEGINIQEIARRLGHAKIEMTWNTYSHLYPREEERAVDILNQIA
jgi:integrase